MSMVGACEMQPICMQRMQKADGKQAEELLLSNTHSGDVKCPAKTPIWVDLGVDFNLYC